MTREEFMKAADIWYKRMQWLTVYSLDKSKSFEKRAWAEHLCEVMKNRMRKVIDISIDMSIKEGQIDTSKFKRGGI